MTTLGLPFCKATAQAACDLIKTRLTYNAHLQKGKEMGLDEAAQTEPVRRQKTTHMPLLGH